MTRKVYQTIAALVDARARCLTSTTRVMDGDTDVTLSHWQDMANRHEVTVNLLCRDRLPNGSGWDSGTTIDWHASTAEKLVFYGEYHHMDDGGFYDGWTEHTVTVRPSLAFGIELKISGRNRNAIKDYLADLFHTALTQDAEG